MKSSKGGVEVFKGRTVAAFVLLGMFASSIMTLTLVNPSAVTRAGSSLIGGAAASGLSSQDLNKISAAYSIIEHNYLTEVEKEKIVNGAINGMVAALGDPFTVYMDEEQVKQFNENMSSSFQGIGAEVTSRDGKIVIVSPIKDSPAERAGIHAKDIIVSVNGESLEGFTLNEAIMKIRGPKGTQAKLKVLREGFPEPIEMIVVRDDIALETVYAEMMDGQIGRIEVTQFSHNTAVRFVEELNKLEGQGMKGLVVDLRNDPGGLLTEAVNIAQLFVPEGKEVVIIEGRDGKQKAELSKQGQGKSYPVSVLINKGSASASEVLAGALQQSAGAKLIGETSFGKGTVQYPFEKDLNGSSIKMTISKWLTPNGTWVHEKGMEPEIKAEQPEFFKVAPLNKEQVLKADMISDHVKNLQIMLKGLGYSVDRTDGYFSTATADSVKAFQQVKGLQATGEVDAKTAGLLEEAIIEAIRDPKNDQQLKAAHDYILSQVKG